MHVRYTGAVEQEIQFRTSGNAYVSRDNAYVLTQGDGALPNTLTAQQLIEIVIEREAFAQSQLKKRRLNDEAPSSAKPKGARKKARK